MNRFLLCLSLLLGLMACASEDSAEPTPIIESTLEPTREPTKPPTATPAVEPTSAVSLEAVMRVDEGGYLFQPVTGYDVSAEDGIIELIAEGGNADTGPTIGIFSLPWQAGLTLDGMLNNFAESFGSEMQMDAPTPVTINGVTGLTADFEGDAGDGVVQGRITGLETETHGVFVIGFSPPNLFRVLFSAEYNAVLNSVELFEMAQPTATPAVEEANSSESTSAKGSTDTEGETDAKSETVVEATPTREPSTPLQLSTENGTACFGTGGFGISCINTDGEWISFTEDNSDLINNYIHDIATCPDGSLLIAQISGIQRYDGETFRTYEPSEDVRSLKSVACGADGEFWVAHFRGVSRYDGNTWTTFDAENLNTTGDQLVDDVEIDGAGHVWVLTPNAIARFDGSEWTIFEEGSGLDDNYFLDRLTIAPDGRPWALANSILLQWDGAVWQSYESSNRFIGQDLTIASDGTAYVATFADGVYDFDGTTWGVTSADNGLAADQTEQIMLDTTGRIYLATVYGLNVWDGEAWVHYTMDSAELLSNEISAIAITNGGPATLPIPVDKANGSVIGSIEIDRERATDATVRLCIVEIFMLFSDEIPCVDDPWFLTAQTDDNGDFLFEDVPVGVYYLAFEIDNSWHVLEGEFGLGSVEIAVFPGEQTDLRALTPAE